MEIKINTILKTINIYREQEETDPVIEGIKKFFEKKEYTIIDNPTIDLEIDPDLEMGKAYSSTGSSWITTSSGSTVNTVIVKDPSRIATYIPYTSETI